MLEARATKLQKYDLTDQPLPVLIREKVRDKVTREERFKYQCLVKFDDCEYLVESPLKAVDVAFKSYHALHATYPVESEPLWQFLQQAVYQFTSKWDKYFESSERLAKEYARFQM